LLREPFLPEFMWGQTWWVWFTIRNDYFAHSSFSPGRRRQRRHGGRRHIRRRPSFTWKCSRHLLFRVGDRGELETPRHAWDRGHDVGEATKVFAASSNPSHGGSPRAPNRHLQGCRRVVAHSRELHEQGRAWRSRARSELGEAAQHGGRGRVRAARGSKARRSQARWIWARQHGTAVAAPEAGRGTMVNALYELFLLTDRGGRRSSCGRTLCSNKITTYANQLGNIVQLVSTALPIRTGCEFEVHRPHALWPFFCYILSWHSGPICQRATSVVGCTGQPQRLVTPM
jgi:hypothetical protein